MSITKNYNKDLDHLRPTLQDLLRQPVKTVTGCPPFRSHKPDVSEWDRVTEMRKSQYGLHTGGKST